MSDLHHSYLDAGIAGAAHPRQWPGGLSRLMWVFEMLAAVAVVLILIVVVTGRVPGPIPSSVDPLPAANLVQSEGPGDPAL
jgi:hypothetical protein